MDIGKLKNNEVYCESDFCDDEIILSLKEQPEFNLHIWEGYIRDLFGNPPMNGERWYGFTRDFNEFVGAFSEKEGNKIEISEVEEYFVDLIQYAEKRFRIEETREVFNLLSDFLRYALATNQTVIMEVV